MSENSTSDSNTETTGILQQEKSSAAVEENSITTNSQADSDSKSPEKIDSSEENKEGEACPLPRFALIVEDARIIRRMLVKIFNHAGYQCDEAENGYEGLSLLRKAKASNYAYHIIATDLMMPEMDGWGFIEQLKSRKIFPGTPVIVITAASTVESVRRCMEQGIRNFIVKPFQTEKVLEVIEKATSTKNLVR